MTVTASGDVDPEWKFWHHGGEKLVFTTESGAPTARERLGQLPEVVALGPQVDFGALLDDLGSRGVRRLMVEGGGQIHTAFLSQSLADEIHLAIAPLVVGAAAAPRFLLPARYPGARMKLLDTRAIGDVVLIRYAPKAG
ncbi:dihydrofolate reductase family protein [Amycolatopsis sp. NPDC051373]|uniref:RibD family protein n=1 Tax=Amycolatopsis sp. NPDC051373 TaxID=3155801 RepID=UPI00344CEA6A